MGHKHDVLKLTLNRVAVDPGALAVTTDRRIDFACGAKGLLSWSKQVAMGATQPGKRHERILARGAVAFSGAGLIFVFGAAWAAEHLPNPWSWVTFLIGTLFGLLAMALAVAGIAHRQTTQPRTVMAQIGLTPARPPEELLGQPRGLLPSRDISDYHIGTINLTSVAVFLSRINHGDWSELHWCVVVKLVREMPSFCARREGGGLYSCDSWPEAKEPHIKMREVLGRSTWQWLLGRPRVHVHVSGQLLCAEAKNNGGGLKRDERFLCDLVETALGLRDRLAAQTVVR